MNRQPGYYAVRYYDAWQVGRFDQGRWYLTYDVLDGDSELSEINETRILMPNEIDSDSQKLFSVFYDLINQGCKFSYDPNKKEIQVFGKAEPKIIDVVVSANNGNESLKAYNRNFAVNHMDLLKKYIDHVSQCEGIDFLDRLNRNSGSDVEFTELEIEALNSLK